MEVVILRGVPGSGKSTLARHLIERNNGVGVIHSTDAYFLLNGVYVFRKKLLPYYHGRNIAAFRKSLTAKIPFHI